MEQKSGGGLFGKLLGKKEPAPKISMGGCDPDLFADEIRTFIETATERKSESVDLLQQRVAHLEFQAQPLNQSQPSSFSSASRSFLDPDPVVSASQPSAGADAAAEEQSAGGSSWESPFEWRPAAQSGGRGSATSPLVTNVPLAVVAEDQEEQDRLAMEQRAREEAEFARRREEEAEAERRREAEAAREREEEDARARDGPRPSACAKRRRWPQNESARSS